jgi:hypothetical protein
MTTYKLISAAVSFILVVGGLLFTVLCLREAIHNESSYKQGFGMLLGLVLLTAGLAIYQSLWEF